MPVGPSHAIRCDDLLSCGPRPSKTQLPMLCGRNSLACRFRVVGLTGTSLQTDFETIRLQLNDHTDRGLGGRQYGTSENIETLQGQNNTSAARLGAVEECSSSFARSGQFARVIRSCHRRIYRVVLFRAALWPLTALSF